jgi:Ser/Thr protein kinase RdoA (MazF antagonist)
MLFDDNMKFQGFIDFDIAEINARVYDISYLLQCLFVGDMNPERISKRLEAARYIFESYNKTVQLTDEEKQAVPYFFVYIGVMLCAWFSKIGLKDLASCVADHTWPYENRHLFVFN